MCLLVLLACVCIEHAVGGASVVSAPFDWLPALCNAPLPLAGQHTGQLPHGPPTPFYFTCAAYPLFEAFDIIPIPY